MVRKPESVIGGHTRKHKSASNVASQSKAAIKLSEETAKLTDGFSTESSEGALGALQTKIDDATVRQKASEVATKSWPRNYLMAPFESATDALSSAKH